VDRVICTLSGTEPSNWCKNERTEVFAYDQLPLPSSQDLRRQVRLDTWTSLEASDACGDGGDKQTVINVTDEWARKWFDTGEGRNWLEENGFPSPPIYAPERECTKDDPRPTLEINVAEGQVVSDPVLQLKGTMDATRGFRSWRLEFGLGSDPDNWTKIAQGDQPVDNALLFNWDLSNLDNQTITLHMYMDGRNGYAERFVHFTLALPTPTPKPTKTPKPTETPAPTDTPPPTDTTVPTDTPTPTETPIPTDTP
jgi:hypothetical protein